LEGRCIADFSGIGLDQPDIPKIRTWVSQGSKQLLDIHVSILEGGDNIDADEEYYVS